MVRVNEFYQITKAIWESLNGLVTFDSENILAAMEDLPRRRHIESAAALGDAATSGRRGMWVLMAITRSAYLATAVLAATLALNAERTPPSTVTFDNQSGGDAVVKLVGPTRGVVPVANRSRAGLHAQAGVYYILVRYGVAGHYSYTKGQEFSVEESGSSYSVITITLHKVVNGN
ncbi:MAG: hypothetical protein ACLPZ0_00680, partial [Steroidobacteraceae bacterium]